MSRYQIGQDVPQDLIGRNPTHAYLIENEPLECLAVKLANGRIVFAIVPELTMRSSDHILECHVVYGEHSYATVHAEDVFFVTRRVKLGKLGFNVENVMDNRP
jgi:hypothetical protein